MKTFTGWREAGQAMRRARQQPSVTVGTRRYGASIDNRSHRGDGRQAEAVTA